MVCLAAGMTVAFGKYFIRNEAKKREKQYGKLQKLTTHLYGWKREVGK